MSGDWSSGSAEIRPSIEITLLTETLTTAKLWTRRGTFSAHDRVAYGLILAGHKVRSVASRGSVEIVEEQCYEVVLPASKNV
jgi:hypothetical protein